MAVGKLGELGQQGHQLVKNVGRVQVAVVVDVYVDHTLRVGANLQESFQNHPLVTER